MLSRDCYAALDNTSICLRQILRYLHVCSCSRWWVRKADRVYFRTLAMAGQSTRMPVTRNPAAVGHPPSLPSFPASTSAYTSPAQARALSPPGLGPDSQPGSYAKVALNASSPAQLMLLPSLVQPPEIPHSGSPPSLPQATTAPVSPPLNILQPPSSLPVVCPCNATGDRTPPAITFRYAGTLAQTATLTGC